MRLVGLAEIRPRRAMRKRRRLPCSRAASPPHSDSAISSSRLADGPASHGPALAGRECVQLVRLWADPPVRDHLPAPVPRLLDGHGRFGAWHNSGRGHARNTSFGSSARPLSRQADPDRRRFLILISANLVLIIVGYAL